MRATDASGWSARSQACVAGDAMSGVVVMAYGTPESRADIRAYYTDIRRGRPPSDEQLADLIRRYEAIGRPVRTA